MDRMADGVHEAKRAKWTYSKHFKAAGRDWVRQPRRRILDEVRARPRQKVRCFSAVC